MSERLSQRLKLRLKPGLIMRELLLDNGVNIHHTLSMWNAALPQYSTGKGLFLSTKMCKRYGYIDFQLCNNGSFFL